MAKSRKTKTGTEGGTSSAVDANQLAKDLGVDVEEAQEKPQNETSPSSLPKTTPDDKSSEESPGNAQEQSAAPASVPTPPKPAQNEPPRPKRSIKEGAVRMDPPIPNEYTHKDREFAEHMKEEVVALALESRNLSIGLRRWEIRHKMSYLLPRWFALSHRSVFVIQGE